MEKAQVDRINELARKKKTVGLTPDEVKEQEALRRQYIDEFKENLRLTLDNVYMEQEDGTYKVVPFVPQVTGLSGKSVNYKSIKLTWDAAEGADGYVIYRATSKTGSYKAIKTIEDGAETEFIRTGLTTGSACYYKVVAYKLIDGEKIYGEASAVVSAKALPEKVTGVKADSA
ncbi:MAG: DUF896 domain-containing protein, partial [Clostridia bacterium]|nr:DUF896 domain-containing protein [Clostridia bacterium]